MRSEIGWSYGHYDVNVFCGQDMENHMFFGRGSVPKIEQSILYRPNAIADAETSSNLSLRCAEFAVSPVVPDLVNNERSLAEKR